MAQTRIVVQIANSIQELVLQKISIETASAQIARETVRTCLWTGKAGHRGIEIKSWQALGGVEEAEVIVARNDEGGAIRSK